MSVNPLQLFENFDKVQPTGESGNFFLPGKYRLAIKALKTAESEQDKGAYFVAEFNTLESSNPDRPVGGTMSQVMFFTGKQAKMTLKNIKALMFAVLKPYGFTSPDLIGQDIMTDAVSGDGERYLGYIVRCEAIMVKTKEGKDFTKCNWSTDAGEETGGAEAE